MCAFTACMQQAPGGGPGPAGRTSGSSVAWAPDLPVLPESLAVGSCLAVASIGVSGEPASGLPTRTVTCPTQPVRVGVRRVRLIGCGAASG